MKRLSLIVILTTVGWVCFRDIEQLAFAMIVMLPLLLIIGGRK